LSRSPWTCACCAARLLAKVHLIKNAAGWDHTLIATESGDVFSWGSGLFGRLGHGDEKDRMLPAMVPPAFGVQVVAVAAGAMHSAALSAQGNLWTWGSGFEGRLGLGDEVDRFVPTRLSCKDFSVGSVAMGRSHTVAVGLDGTLWAWGSNDFGQLGLGHTVNEKEPRRIGGQQFSAAVIQAACGDFFTLALTADKRLPVWTWGLGARGRLGHNDEVNRHVPTNLGRKAFHGQEVRAIDSKLQKKKYSHAANPQRACPGSCPYHSDSRSAELQKQRATHKRSQVQKLHLHYTLAQAHITDSLSLLPSFPPSPFPSFPVSLLLPSFSPPIPLSFPGKSNCCWRRIFDGNHHGR